MRTTSVGVFRIATKGPGDVSGLMSLIGSGVIDPTSILAILGKTEGNGGVNDFTREYAVAALCTALAPQLGLHAARGRAAHRVRDVRRHRGRAQPAHHGVHAPAGAKRRQASSGKRLSIGMAQTRDFLPEELAALHRSPRPPRR